MSSLNNHILPPNSKSDDQLNANFIIDSLVKEVNISTLPLEAELSLLPHLALAYGVEITGLNEVEARNYLNQALDIHRHKGTVYAVKKAIEIMFSEGVLVESFESEKLRNSDFLVKIDFLKNKKDKYGKDFFTLSKRLIEESKNVRSHFLGFDFNLPLQIVDFNFSSNLSTKPLMSNHLSFEELDKKLLLSKPLSVMNVQLKNNLVPLKAICKSFLSVSPLLFGVELKNELSFIEHRKEIKIKGGILWLV